MAVFVSYSHKDAVPVHSIVRRLSGRGHSVWWDKNLLGGADFGLAIQKALENSKCVVVAWSGAAQHSLWVRAEANSACEAGKLVQLTLDGTRPPPPFSMLHALDFRSDDGSTDAPPMKLLLQSVDLSLVGTSPADLQYADLSLVGTSPVDASQAFSGESPWNLAGFGPAAAVGGASLGLVILASGLVSMAPNLRSADLYGLGSNVLFVISILGFAHLLVRVILTYLASRKT